MTLVPVSFFMTWRQKFVHKWFYRLVEMFVMEFRRMFGYFNYFPCFIRITLSVFHIICFWTWNQWFSIYLFVLSLKSSVKSVHFYSFVSIISISCRFTGVGERLTMSFRERRYLCWFIIWPWDCLLFVSGPSVGKISRGNCLVDILAK